MNALLDQVLIDFNGIVITLGQIALFLLSLIPLIALYGMARYRWLPRYFTKEEVVGKDKRKILRLVRLCAIVLFLLLGLTLLQLDYTLYTYNEVDFKVSIILQALAVFLFARLADWLISKVLIHNYFQNRAQDATQQDVGTNIPQAGHIIQPVVYSLAVLFLLHTYDINITLFTIGVGDNAFPFRVSSIFTAIFILVTSRLIAWILTQLVLFGYYNRQQVNVGSQYAINRLLKYFLYVVAALMAIETLGVELTVLWGGAAALLVGIGLGLQQTFNDLICGIILLFERTVEVEDVVDLGGMVGTVRKIGIRTSLVETRDSITVIVPNSKLVGENIINWSHTDKKARFRVNIGVAYGSDTQLVKKLLLRAAETHGKILKRPGAFVRFIDFGESSLDFELHFWSPELVRIEDVKSDLRFLIDKLFRENSIEIPFPQRDVWFKNQLQNNRVGANSSPSNSQSNATEQAAVAQDASIPVKTEAGSTADKQAVAEEKEHKKAK